MSATNTTKDSDVHLSQITTEWSQILEAHRHSDEETDQARLSAAQQEILKRYGRSIHRYLLGATHDSNAADELAQEFAFRFVRGDLRNANPSNGRFRDYLKAVLRNIVNDYFRRQAKEQKLIGRLDGTEGGKIDPADEVQTEFRESWRQDILNLTWDQLRQYSESRTNSYFSVLQFRAENPDLDSAASAEQLSEVLDREVNAAWVRQTLHRARVKFSELLVLEVSRTLTPSATREEIDRELAELRLLKYVQIS